MPELPEIETIKNVIGPQIKGLTIEQITLSRPEIIAHPTADEFCAAVTGQTISFLSRRGKFLILHLKNDSRIILHLRMTGCLLAAPPDHPMEKHAHMILRLDSGTELHFSDTRRFGRFWLIQNGEEDTYSGIGNIYSDEILFRAKIRPARPANSLTEEEWQRLAAEIPKCLSYFIEKNRISPEEYLQGKGQDYRNTPFLQVYGHGGEPCQNCGTTLVRTVISGRSSVYCPACQK